MKILLDVDEVLADFVGGALRLHGWTREQFYAAHPPGTWEIEGTLGITAAQLWEPINAMGEAFWRGLDQLSWAGDLLAAFEYTDVWLVSAPGPSVESYTGKLRWLQDVLHWPLNRCILTADKPLLAAADTVLIDDRESTVTQFTARGGQGIVFPSWHNSLFDLAYDPVSYVVATFFSEDD